MTNKEIKNNNWSLLNLFFSFIKSNKMIIFVFIFVPIYFVFISLITNNSKLDTMPSFFVTINFMIIFIIQAAAVSFCIFLSILFEFKSSVLYRRIGLTQIKSFNFLIVSSIFNFILLLISTFISILIIIIYSLIFNPNLMKILLNWKMSLVALAMIGFALFATSLVLMLSILIKTRVIQGIVSSVMLTLFGILFIVFSIIVSISSANSIPSNMDIIAIFSGFFVCTTLISILFYYISWKIFKWYD